MRTCAECLMCLITRELQSLPSSLDAQEKTDYLLRVFALAADSKPEETTSEISARVAALRKAQFGQGRDYAAIKERDNQLMLLLEDELWAEMQVSADPIRHALKLAQAGNYIDYGTLGSVSADTLKLLLRSARDREIDEAEYGKLASDLRLAKRLVYITDNCGEAVLDKLAIKQMKRQYPDLGITVLARGDEALNDLTVYDAKRIGLDAIVPVIGNGTGYPGTVMSQISKEAVTLLQSADLIIAKGQGNFETLHGCGLNIYYLFLCKCDLFIRRFGVEPLTAMLVNEKRITAL